MSLLEVNKITPQSGTTLTLGDVGDTINFGSGVLPNFENLTVTGDLTVDTNSLYVDSANNYVGIGTASPEFPLDIQSDTNANAIQLIGRASDNISQITFTSNDKLTDYLDIQAGASEIDFQGRGSIPMLFKTNLSEAMRIDSSGNVLVGHTYGTTILGTSQSLSSSPNLFTLRASSNQFGPLHGFVKSRNSALGSNTIVQDNDTLGRIYFIGDDGVDYETRGAQIDVEVDGTPGANNIPGRIVFSTNSGAAFVSEAMRIDSAAHVSLSGDTDTYWDFVSANQQRWVCGGAETFRTYQIAGAYGIVQANGSGSSTYPNFTFNGDTNTGMYRATTDTLAFTTGGSERMRITSSGNVGIGTSDPIRNLEIVATNSGAEITAFQIRNNATAAGTASALRFTNSTSNTSNAGSSKIVGYRPGVTNDGELHFYTADNSATMNNRMVIDSSGRVGIGTTSPSYRLHVDGNDSTNPQLWLKQNNNGTGILRLTRQDAADGQNGDWKLDHSSQGLFLYHSPQANSISSPSWTNTLRIQGANNSYRIIPGQDDVQDLGTSDRRWQDLYLGGSVYLGGTGSANALDDYETGTWTPEYKASATNFSSITYDSSTVGNYVKVGSKVFCYGILMTDSLSGGSGSVRIIGLPFSVKGSTFLGNPGTLGGQNAWINAPTQITQIDTSDEALLGRIGSGDGAYTQTIPSDMGTGGNDNRIYFSFCYESD